MDSVLWTEIQEGLLFVFGPVLIWWMIIILIGALLSAIGVVIMEELPRIDPLD